MEALTILAFILGLATAGSLGPNEINHGLDQPLGQIEPK